MLKTNPQTYKIKDWNAKTVIGSFYEKEFVLSKLWMSYYPEPENHIRHKGNIVLDISNYVTKKELEHAAAFDTAAKNILLLQKLKLTN